MGHGPLSPPLSFVTNCVYVPGEGDGDKPGSPSKSDPMDSASGGETLEERSSKEVMLLCCRLIGFCLAQVFCLCG